MNDNIFKQEQNSSELKYLKKQINSNDNLNSEKESTPKASNQLSNQRLVNNAAPVVAP